MLINSHEVTDKFIAVSEFKATLLRESKLAVSRQICPKFFHFFQHFRDSILLFQVPYVYERYCVQVNKQSYFLPSGGWLSLHFGFKRVVGAAMFVSSFFTLLSPLAADLGFACFFCLRSAMGACHGVVFPALHGAW